MWQGIPYLAAFLISSAIGIAAVIALETLQRNPRKFCGTAFDGNASFSIIVVCRVHSSIYSSIYYYDNMKEYNTYINI